MPDPVELVCFDLGRVLIRLCDGWRHGCELAGVPVPAGELSDSAQTQLREVIVLSDLGRISSAEFCERCAAIFGAEPAHVAAMSDAYLLGPFPGVDELLDDLHAAGLKTACLSNTNENHWRIMTDPSHPARLPLHRLDHRFASHLLGLRKPDDAIYQHVERETGVAGSRILFFDDLVENIAGAKRRGWQGHQIIVGEDPILQMRTRLRDAGVRVAPD